MKIKIQKIIISFFSLTLLFVSQNVLASSVTVFVNEPVLSCTINNFSASQTSITNGDSAFLNWNTSNCTNVTISKIGHNVPTSGTQTVWPTNTTTYTLTAYSSAFSFQTRNVTVYVEENTNICEISNFSASDTNINDGEYTTLRWNTNNCSRVNISNIGNVSESGSRTISPQEDTVYTITAYNANNSHVTDTIRIYVDQNSDCSIDSFTANNTYINSGDSIVLRWSTSNCDSVNISNIGNVSESGSRTISPASTTTYTLRAYGKNTETRSIQINVEYIQTPQTPVYNVGVITTIANNISQTSAQINGLITNSNYNNSNVYFEYGETTNLGLQTASRSANGVASFSDFLTNLKPDTFYYFRAVAVNQNGPSFGSIEVFKTLANVKISTPAKTTKVTKIVKPTTVVQNSNIVLGVESSVILKIENRYQTIKVGDVIDYTVYYKNISSSKLTRPMVQVYFPKGIEFVNSSGGTYSNDNKTLSAPIGDLNPGDEGYLYTQAKVDSIDSKLAQIVTTAVLIYTKPNEAQENTMAYVLNNPDTTNSNLLGASAFWGSLLNLGLIGWLLLIIFILLLILLARTFSQRRQIVVASPQAHH